MTIPKSTLTVDYSYDRNTGIVHLHFDYTSAPQHRRTHNDDHRALMRQILENTGLLARHGQAHVSITRDGWITNWEVSKVGDEYHWEKLSMTPLPEQAAEKKDKKKTKKTKGRVKNRGTQPNTDAEWRKEQD